MRQGRVEEAEVQLRGSIQRARGQQAKSLSVNKDVHYPSVRDGRGTEEANGEGKA